MPAQMCCLVRVFPAQTQKVGMQMKASSLTRYIYIYVFERLNGGSYMSAHVLNLLNKLSKRDKLQGSPSILSLFATGLINSIIQEHKC